MCEVIICFLRRDLPPKVLPPLKECVFCEDRVGLVWHQIQKKKRVAKALKKRTTTKEEIKDFK